MFRTFGILGVLGVGLGLVSDADAAILVSDGAAIPASPALRTLPDSDADGLIGSGMGDGSTDVAQSFTLSSAVQVDAIYLQYASGVAGKAVTIELRTYTPPTSTTANFNGSGSVIGAANLVATSSFTTPAAFAASGVLKLDLTGADEVSLAPGTYALILREAVANNAFNWVRSTGGSSPAASFYAGGRAYGSDAGGGNGLIAMNSGERDFAMALTAVPEPASVALLGLGGLLVAGRRRRA